jgi:hypothetical protein
MCVDRWCVWLVWPVELCEVRLLDDASATMILLLNVALIRACALRRELDCAAGVQTCLKFTGS